ncbi:hypothetical protein ACM66B_005008 [Microbotryomycetes sp. NB124-2]
MSEERMAIDDDDGHETYYIDPCPPGMRAEQLVGVDDDQMVTSNSSSTLTLDDLVADLLDHVDSATEEDQRELLSPEPSTRDSTTPTKSSSDRSHLEGTTAAADARTRVFLNGHVCADEAPTLFAQLGVEQTAWGPQVEATRVLIDQDENAQATLSRCHASFLEEKLQRGHRTGARHWLDDLASLALLNDAARPTPPAPSTSTSNDDLSLVIHSKPREALRVSSTDALLQERKPDATLQFRSAFIADSTFKPSLHHLVAAFEFSTTSAMVTKREKGLSISSKLHQLAGLLVAIMASQPFRTHVPGLAICDDTATAMLLSRNALLVYHVKQCWTTIQGAAELAALVHTLLNLQPWQVGLFPLFRYSLSCEHGIRPSDIRTDVLTGRVPDLALAEPYQPINVVRKVSPYHSPFSRGTVVVSLQDKDLTRSIIIKLQAVGLDRRRRESEVWAAISEPSSPLSDETKGSLLEVLSTVELARHVQVHYLPPNSINPRRHALVVSRNPGSSLPQPVDRPGLQPTALLRLVEDAFNALSDLFWKARVPHCDISANNVLHDDGKLVICDWDCGIVVKDTVSEQVGQRWERTGTLDTMAVNALRAVVEDERENGSKAFVKLGSDFSHHLRHDFESIVYALLKVMWANLRHTADEKERGLVWSQLCFDDTNIAVSDLYFKRSSLWGGQMLGLDLVDRLRLLSPALADFVEALLALPFEKFARFKPNEEEDIAAGERVKFVFKSVKWDEIGTDELMRRWGQGRREQAPTS